MLICVQRQFRIPDVIQNFVICIVKGMIFSSKCTIKRFDGRPPPDSLGVGAHSAPSGASAPMDLGVETRRGREGRGSRDPSFEKRTPPLGIYRPTAKLLKSVFSNTNRLSKEMLQHNVYSCVKIFYCKYSI